MSNISTDTQKPNNFKRNVAITASCGLVIFFVVFIAQVSMTRPEPQIAEASFEDKIGIIEADNAILTEANVKLQKEIEINNQQMTANNEQIKLLQMQYELSE